MKQERILFQAKKYIYERIYSNLSCGLVDEYEDGGGGGNDGARGCCWWVTVARTTVTMALPHWATVAIKLTGQVGGDLSALNTA